MAVCLTAGPGRPRMRTNVHRLLPLLALILWVLPSACTTDDGRDRSTAALYVAISASDGIGTGASNPSVDGWVPRLRSMMPAGTRLANLSIPSLKVEQALDQVLPVAVDLQPSVVTVWLCVNDLTGGVPLEVYRTGLDALLGALVTQTTARVYVANLPDLTLLPALHGMDGGALRSTAVEWNAAIAGVAQTHGATVVDLYTGWAELRSHPEYISRDGLHPSTLGHQRLAELFWGVISGL